MNFQLIPMFCNKNVFNFSVEDDESYTASGVVVHNCIALMMCLMADANIHKKFKKDKI